MGPSPSMKVLGCICMSDMNAGSNSKRMAQAKVLS